MRRLEIMLCIYAWHVYETLSDIEKSPKDYLALHHSNKEGPLYPWRTSRYK